MNRQPRTEQIEKLHAVWRRKYSMPAKIPCHGVHVEYCPREGFVVMTPADGRVRVRSRPAARGTSTYPSTEILDLFLASLVTLEDRAVYEQRTLGVDVVKGEERLASSLEPDEHVSVDGAYR